MRKLKRLKRFLAMQEVNKKEEEEEGEYQLTTSIITTWPIATK